MKNFERYSRLTIIKRNGLIDTTSGKREAVWLCQCDCSVTKFISATTSALKSGQIRSCRACRHLPDPPKDAQQPALPDPYAVLSHDGRRQSIEAWAEESGIKKATIRSRLRQGWSIRDALTVPPGGRCSQHLQGQKRDRHGRLAVDFALLEEDSPEAAEDQTADDEDLDPAALAQGLMEWTDSLANYTELDPLPVRKRRRPKTAG
ncbi:MAG: hypothetical protein ACR2P3_01910 [Geminicoccaceae bacterium]